MFLRVVIQLFAAFALSVQAAPEPPEIRINSILKKHRANLKNQRQLIKKSSNRAAVIRGTSDANDLAIHPPASTVYELAALIRAEEIPTQNAINWATSLTDICRMQVMRIIELQIHQDTLATLALLREHVMFDLLSLHTYATPQGVRDQRMLNDRISLLAAQIEGLRGIAEQQETVLMNQASFQVVVQRLVQSTLPLVQMVEIPQATIAAVEEELHQQVFELLHATGGNYKAILGGLHITRMELRRIWNMLDDPSTEMNEKLEQITSMIEYHMQKVNAVVGGLQTWPIDSPLVFA